MDDYDGPRNQTLPPELDELEDELPEYQLHDASRQMLSGTADATGMISPLPQPQYPYTKCCR